MGGATRVQNALHRPWQPLRERLQRELQQSVSGRVPEPGELRLRVRSKSLRQRIPARRQPPATALGTGIPDTRGVRPAQHHQPKPRKPTKNSHSEWIKNRGQASLGSRPSGRFSLWSCDVSRNAVWSFSKSPSVASARSSHGRCVRATGLRK